MSGSSEPRLDVRLRELGRVAVDARRLVEQRDAAIVAAVARGASQREVARAAGMSHTAVAHIVHRAGR